VRRGANQDSTGREFSSSSNITFVTRASSLGLVPRGMPRHLPGPSVAGSGSSTQSRPASLLQWRMVALLNMLDKLPGNEESCWCTTQC